MKTSIGLRISPFLLLCIMGGLAIFSSTMSKNPVLPLFIRALNVPVSTVGFIAAASTIVGIIVSLPAGVLSDIIGRRRVILTAAVVFATAPFLYLLVSQPWHLVLVRVYHGLATAILGPVAMAAVADTFDEKRGERIAWYSSATMMGRFVAPFVGGALIFGQDFRWVYLADGVIGVLALIAALKVPFSTISKTGAGQALKRGRTEIRRDIIAIIGNRGILTTSLIEATQYFSSGFLEVFLPIFLHEQAGFSPLEIGSLFTVQILVAAFTKPVMGRLSDRYGRVPMIVAGLSLSGVATGLMTFTHNYALVAIFIGLFGLGLATTTASTAALVVDLSRASNYGGALGGLSSIMDVGQSAGPMVGGIVIGAFGYGTAFGAIGIALVLVSLAFGVGMRQARGGKLS